MADILALTSAGGPGAAAAATAVAQPAWRALLLAAAAVDDLGLWQQAPAPSSRPQPQQQQQQQPQPQQQQQQATQAADQIAAALAKRCASLSDLLGLLSPPGGGAATGAGIRRFCGVSDLQRAALVILRAALSSGAGGAPPLPLAGALEALNGLVASAGPGFAAQPALLVAVARAYADAEAQLLALLQLEAAANAAAVPGAGAAPACLPAPPPALCAALQLAGGAAAERLPPGHPVAAWVLFHAEGAPGAAQELLSGWLALLSAGDNAVDADERRAFLAAAADALAAAPGALPLLLSAASKRSRGEAAGGGSGAAAMTALLALAARLLELRQELFDALLGDGSSAGLEPPLRRCLLEHAGCPEAASCAAAAACCGALLAAAAAAPPGAEGAARLAHAVGPLVQLAAARLLALPNSHPLLPQLRLALLNAAGALAFRSLLASAAGEGEGGCTAAAGRRCLGDACALAQEAFSGGSESAAPPGAQCDASSSQQSAAHLLALVPAGSVDAAAAQADGRLAGAQLLHLIACLDFAAAGGANADGPARGGDDDEPRLLGALSVPRALLLSQAHPSGTLRLLALQSLLPLLLGRVRRHAPLRALPAAALLCALQNHCASSAAPLVHESAQAALALLLEAAAAEAAAADSGGGDSGGNGGDPGQPETAAAAAVAAAAAAHQILVSRWHPKLLDESLSRARAAAAALLTGGGGGVSADATGGGCGAAALLQQPRQEQWALLAGDLSFAAALLQHACLSPPPPTGAAATAGPAAKTRRAAAARAAAALKAVAARHLEETPLLALLCAAAGGALPAAGRGAAAEPGALLGALASARALRMLLGLGLLGGHARKALEALQAAAYEQRLALEHGGGGGGMAAALLSPPGLLGEQAPDGGWAGGGGNGAGGGWAAAAVAAEVEGFARLEAVGGAAIGLARPPLLRLLGGRLAAAGDEDTLAGGREAALESAVEAAVASSAGGGSGNGAAAAVQQLRAALQELGAGVLF